MTFTHIFISYRTSQREFALKLAERLVSKKIAIWIDCLSIKAGDDWVAELQTAIDNASALISIISPEYIDSKYCRREIKRADTINCPIFPIVIQKIGKTMWPLEIQELQYIDFTQWRVQQEFDASFTKLYSVLHRKLAISLSNNVFNVQDFSVSRPVPARTLEDQLDLSIQLLNSTSSNRNQELIKRLEQLKDTWDFQFGDTKAQYVDSLLAKVNQIIESIPNQDNSVPSMLYADEKDSLEDEQASLIRQIERHRRNLNRLEEMRSNYGIRVPLDLLNEIEHERDQIREKQKRLKQ